VSDPGPDPRLTPQGDRAVVADRLQAIQGSGGVDGRVERESRLVLREPVPVRVPRILFLNMRRVGQHQRAQVLGARRAENSPSISHGDKTRQIPAVIEVRVRQDDRVNRGRIDRERLPVAQPQLFQPLKQAAIDENPAPVDLEKMFGARDGPGRPQKGQLHGGRMIRCLDPSTKSPRVTFGDIEKRLGKG
jgi:hypothetical protein